MSILKFRDDQGVVHEMTVLRGPKGYKGDKGEPGIQGPQGEQGHSGVYVGSGEMPTGYSVQIDPNGDTLSINDIISSVITSLPVWDGGAY